MVSQGAVVCFLVALVALYEGRRRSGENAAVVIERAATLAHEQGDWRSGRQQLQRAIDRETGVRTFLIGTSAKAALWSALCKLHMDSGDGSAALKCARQAAVSVQGRFCSTDNYPPN